MIGEWDCARWGSRGYNKIVQQKAHIFKKLVSFSLNFSVDCNNSTTRQWLWLSWLSGHFRYQRSAVQILSAATVILNIVYCQLY